MVHFFRNVFTDVPSGKVSDVARKLNAMHAQEYRRWAGSKIKEVITKLKAMRLTKAAELIDSKGHETLTYFAFPSNHWRQIITNNPRNASFARSGAAHASSVHFQTGTALMLVAARLRHIASTKWGKRRYMAMGKRC